MVAIQATSFYSHSCRNGVLYIYFYINLTLFKLHAFWCTIPHLFTVLRFCFFLVSYSTCYCIYHSHIMVTLLTEFPLAVQLVHLICVYRVRFAGNVVVRDKFCWMHALNFAPSSSTFMSFAIRQLLHNAFSSAYTGRSSWTATASSLTAPN